MIIGGKIHLDPPHLEPRDAAAMERRVLTSMVRVIVAVGAAVLVSKLLYGILVGGHVAWWLMPVSFIAGAGVATLFWSVVLELAFRMDDTPDFIRPRESPITKE